MQKTIETRKCTDQIMHIQEERHTCTGKSTYRQNHTDARMHVHHTDKTTRMHGVTQTCTGKIMILYEEIYMCTGKNIQIQEEIPRCTGKIPHLTKKDARVMVKSGT